MAVPIWKDYTLTFTGTTARYRIRVGSTSGRIIYQGLAVARPDEASCKVRINEICADYISQSLPAFGQSFTTSDFSMTFVVEWNASGSQWEPYTVTFLYDWSYDWSYDAVRDGMSFPIAQVVDGRMLIPVTTPTGAAVTAVLTKADGTTQTVTLQAHGPADFNDDFNDDYAIFDTAAQPGTAVLDLSQYLNVVSVTIGGHTYFVDRSGCHRYALYYVNAYGGWDALLLRGRSVETDGYQRHTAKVDYSNTTPEGRGIVNYVNEVDKRYTLRTGWLSDLGGQRAHHLVGTTLAYLHDLLTDLLLPVNIEDSECVYKSYHGEGNRPVQYEITASVAQERVRR